MAAQLENHMVVGEYYPNWVDATDADFDLRVSEIQDALCNEDRAELIDDINGGVFAEAVVNILLSDLSGEDKLSEIRAALDHEITTLAKWKAGQE